MKKLLFLTIFIQMGLLYSQNTMVLNFNQDNLVPNTNTFQCEGSFTYFTINTNPIDTIYNVTNLSSMFFRIPCTKCIRLT